MKKWFTAVCTAVMLASACAGLTACGDKEVSLTMQQIYDANATATILTAYEKTGVVQTNALTGTIVKTYLDGEVYYRSTAKDNVIVSECYDKEGTVGYVFEDGKYFSLLTTPENLKAKPTQAYENQVFEDKTLTLSEEVVSSVQKKDGIYVQTKYGAENSVKVATADGLECKEGEYLQTNYVLDKDTYRVITLERALVTANGTTQYFKIEQKTDVRVTDADYTADLVPILTSVKALKNADNGDNIWMMHVEANSNTPNEVDWKAIALKEHSFKIDLGKRYPTVYRDVGLETEYVYADTDKNNGYIKLYAKRAFIPEEYGFTWQDILNVNTTQALLNKYDSITVTTTYEGEEDSGIGVTYIDDKMVYTGYDDTSRCYLMDGTKGYKKLGNKYFVIIDKESDMQADVRDIYETAVFDAPWKAKERIDYAETRGGKLYVTTLMDKADYEELTGGEFDFAYLQTEYVFDTKTYRLCEYTQYVVYPDERKIQEQTVTLTVNAETAPIGAEETYAKLTATENVAFITVYLCDGENLTRLYNGQRVKGDGLTVEYNDGTVELYVDEACTQAFEDTDKQKNTLVLYAVISGQGE